MKVSGNAQRATYRAVGKERVGMRAALKKANLIVDWEGSRFHCSVFQAGQMMNGWCHHDENEGWYDVIGALIGSQWRKMKVSSNHEARGMITSVHVSVSGVGFNWWIRTSFAFILNAKDMVPHLYSSDHLGRPRKSRGSRMRRWLAWGAARLIEENRITKPWWHQPQNSHTIWSLTNHRSLSCTQTSCASHILECTAW